MSYFSFHASKSFGHRTILENVRFEVNRGEFISVLGKSGSGKTTLLRLIAGFERFDTGRITLNGGVLSDETMHTPPEKRRIGVVFQDHALWPHMSVFENIAFPLKLQKNTATHITERVKSVLCDVHMNGFEKAFPNELSGGESQRISLARTLIQNPDLIIFDEPLASLDVMLRYDVQGMIKRVTKEKQLTCIYITHDQGEAMRLSDRIAILEGGHLLQYDTPHHIYTSPRTENIAKLLGQGGCLPARIKECNIQNERASVIIESDNGDVEGSFHILNAAYMDDTALQRPQDVSLCVRSEHIELQEIPFVGHNAQTLQDLDTSALQDHLTLVMHVTECYFARGVYVLQLVMKDNSAVTLRAHLPHPMPVGAHMRCTIKKASIIFCV